MNTPSFVALRRLSESLPPCDVLNLGYAMLIEGEVPRDALKGAVHEVAAADPLLDGGLHWIDGCVDRNRFGYLAAEHLSAPIEITQPLRVALWSSGVSTHLFLLTVHHLVADGVVLDRIATDLTRSLQGEKVKPVSQAQPRPLPIPPEFSGAGIPIRTTAPSLRASCRAIRLSDELVKDLRDVARGWRTTSFVAAVTCVAAVVAEWTGASEIGISIQTVGRTSSDAQRAPGPWYDHVDLGIKVTPGEPLRGLLLETTSRTLKALTVAGNWSVNRQSETHPELLIVYDRHPLSSLKIPSCKLQQLAVHRRPLRADGIEEYLVPTDADVIVFFREQADAVSLTLFTKTARIPEQTADWLLNAIASALHGLAEESEQPLELIEAPPPAAECTPPATEVSWREPTLSDFPMVDAVSPAFQLRHETLNAFANDACSTLESWGKAPWL